MVVWILRFTSTRQLITRDEEVIPLFNQIDFLQNICYFRTLTGSESGGTPLIAIRCPQLKSSHFVDTCNNFY
jgi:hypothetical protein